MTLGTTEIWSEAANIGAGLAMSSLSCIFNGYTFILSVPRVGPQAFGECGVVVQTKIEGDFNGAFNLWLSDESAREMAERLIGDTTAGELDRSAQAVLLEVGNILASSFVDGISKMYGGRLLPTPPTLKLNARYDFDEELREKGVMVTIPFFAREGCVRGHLSVGLNTTQAHYLVSVLNSSG